MASTIQLVQDGKLSKSSNDDRISKLPEPILLHILSFLSTKQAATTSVLSKQWQYLWTWVPDLDINDSEIDAEDTDDISFYRMVFKIFVSRRASLIRKLRLSCNNFNCERFDVRSILHKVHDHDIPIDFFPRFDNLVELKVYDCYDRCSLPLLVKMLLNCSRLEHLILVSTMTGTCEKTQCWISPRHVPNCLAFHLTTIKYEGFQASEAKMEFIEYVLNNSKVLRNMTISYRREMNSKGIMLDAFLKISKFEKQATRCQLNFQQLP